MSITHGYFITFSFIYLTQALFHIAVFNLSSSVTFLFTGSRTFSVITAKQMVT